MFWKTRSRTAALFALAWALTAYVAWLLSPARTLPGPGEVARAFADLWWHGGLGPELGTTIALIASALFVSVAVSLAVAWGGAHPALRPVAGAVSKLRFLGLTGLVFPLTLATGGGFRLKVALLAFGMTTFLATALVRIVREVPTSHIEYARSLGASDARVLWEVVVRGTLDRTLDAIRQNVAMGWSMITMVEGISRSDGGVGALLLAENKHFRLAEVYAVLFVVLAVGLAIDFSFGLLGRALCPHARLERSEA